MTPEPLTLQRAAEAVADRIPGSSVAGGGKLIRLPIPGVTVEFRTGPSWGRPEVTDGTLHLRLRGRDRFWCNSPNFVRLDSWAFRASREIRDLILNLRDEAPARREHQADRQLTVTLKTYVPPREAAEAEECAISRGMSVSSLIRRGLLLAMQEAREGWDDVTPEQERCLRSSMRLLMAGKPCPGGDDPILAEVGGGLDLLKATRLAVRARCPDPDPNRQTRRIATIAEILGIGWLFGGYMGHEVDCTGCGKAKVWVPAGDTEAPVLCRGCIDAEEAARPTAPRWKPLEFRA